MADLKIRPLRAEEIEVRVGMARQNGISLLLYKNARCDMNILDEAVGVERWQRKHYECKNNLYCSVGIKFGDIWIWKDDCGTESNMEKQKGEASDAFKRACVNWGIGRELYTTPFIWVGSNACKIEQNGNRCVCKDSFSVIDIEITESGNPFARQISRLKIKNNSTDSIVFSWEAITCPKCGKIVNGIVGKSGQYHSPEKIIQNYGSCIDCHKASKEVGNNENGK